MLNKEFIKSLQKGLDDSKRRIKEQKDREKNDPSGRIRLESPGVFWDVFTKQVWIKGEEYPCIELSWGWTAGLTPEQIENIAEDSPKGHQSLIITEDIARELLAKLTEILKAVSQHDGRI